VTARKSEVKRERYRHVMSRYDILMASVGTVIGSGWLFGSYFAARYAGPAAIFSWIIAGVLFLVIELPFAEMAAMFPEAGAPARMPQLAFGTLASSMTSWTAVLGGGFGVAIECLAVVQYAGGYIPALFNKAAGAATPLGLLVTAVLMLIFMQLALHGVRLFSKTITVWTTIKWVVPSCAAILLIIAGLTQGGASNFSSAGGFMPYGFEPVLTAIALGGLIYAYSGPRSAMALAAEGANPKKDVPFALLCSILGALVLYTLLQIAFILAIPHSALAGGWAHISFSSPMAQLALGIGLGWLGIVLYIDAAVSPAGTGLLLTGTSSRTLYAIEKNGFGVPKWLRRLDHRGVPATAQWTAYVLGLIAIMPFPSWHSLIVLTSSAGILGYMLSGSSLGAFRRTAPDMARPFSVGRHARWLGPTAMAIATSMFLWYGWPTTMRVGIWYAVGLILYAIFFNTQKLPRRDIRAGIWLPVLLFSEVLLSWLGSFGSGNLHILPFPLDEVVAIALGIGFYYWSIRCAYETDAVKEMKEGKNVDYHEELVVEDLGIAIRVPEPATEDE
jgi:amino acid transporter